MCGDSFGFGHVVRCKNNSGASLRKRRNDVADGVTPVNVDTRGGFVEEDDFRVSGESESERDPLLLTAREATPGAFHSVCETDLLNKSSSIDLLAIEGTEMPNNVAYAGAWVHAPTLQHDAHARGELRMLGLGV